MRVELYGCLHGTVGGDGFLYHFHDNNRGGLKIPVTE